ISYGTSQDFDNDDIDFKNLSAGFGGDFGLTYEYRSNNDIDSISIGHGNYKLKVGVSVTDIGSISYDESTTTTYNVDNTVSTNSFEDEDIETALDEQYVGTEEIGKTEISLPTAMHVLVDYKFRKRLYMSVHGSFSLVDKNDPYANRIINTVTATPRLETRWFSFYLPLSLRQHDGFAMGAGFRLGPLTVGSGSLLSNYLMDDSRTADIYVGLKIPVYRK
ncbi:MAG TPA: DUF5723 family protein, partial [Salinimicrobium sp.]|nr:DUF5723 family protein [Salinimicrobium sp.]